VAHLFQKWINTDTAACHFTDLLLRIFLQDLKFCKALEVFMFSIEDMKLKDMNSSNKIHVQPFGLQRHTRIKKGKVK
jgi:hypothetical protein